MIIKQYYNIQGSKNRGMLVDVTFNDEIKNAPVVIFAHGFKGFKDWGTHNLVARYFAEKGFRFLKFNFSHNGTTADNPTDFTDLIAFADNTFSIELEDLHRIIDFVCGGSVMARVSGVYLIGHSMGGGISIITAAEDPRVIKMVTMAAISSFRNLWPKEIEGQWRLSGIIYLPNKRTGQDMPLKSTLLDDLHRNPERLDIIRMASRVAQPWLIVHGDIDPTVPLTQAVELQTAQPTAELIVIEGGDHVFGATHPYLKDTLPAPLELFCREAVNFFNT